MSQEKVSNLYVQPNLLLDLTLHRLLQGFSDLDVPSWKSVLVEPLVRPSEQDLAFLVDDKPSNRRFRKDLTVRTRIPYLGHGAGDFFQLVLEVFRNYSVRSLYSTGKHQGDSAREPQMVLVGETLKMATDTASGIRWNEPAEGLEFGEIFLGGIASINLGRGRSSGYAVYFSDRRIIGVWTRFVARALLIPYLVVIGSLFVLTVIRFSSRDTLFLFLPLVLIVADQAFRILSRWLAERFISRKGAEVARAVKGKKNLEVRRSDIGGLLMKSPERGISLGYSGGFLRIILKQGEQGMVEIKIRGLNQYHSLRELVIRFATSDPKIPADEYPRC